MPERPFEYTSPTIPTRCSIRAMSASSAPAPTAPRRRAGPASATGAPTMPAPPALAMPEAAKTNGSSGYASCQAGTAVSASSTAVYVVSAGPSTAEPTPAARPTPGSRPATSRAVRRPATFRTTGTTRAGSSVAIAIPAKVPNGARIHEPTFIGEVHLNTRSMFTKRSGTPRSCTSATTLTTAAPPAVSREARRSVGRPVRSPNAPTADALPARPPR